MLAPMRLMSMPTKSNQSCVGYFWRARRMGSWISFFIKLSLSGGRVTAFALRVKKMAKKN
jgi:hypothetical protein